MQRLASGRVGIEIRPLMQWLSVRHSSAEAAPASDNSELTEQIIIPKRINRSSTDLLKALSGTVGRDPTMPHYKFHDDPFLIPESTGQRLQFALAEESGRKAARWIVNEHAELFNVSNQQS